MDNRQLSLFLVFSFSLVMLWDGWQRQGQPKVPAVAKAGVVSGVPSLSNPSGGGGLPVSQAAVVKAATTTIETDVYAADISAQGGDITRLELLSHPATLDKTRKFRLFDNGEKHIYLAQSGLIGEGLPNHKTTWHLIDGEHQLKPGVDELSVRLEADAVGGRKIVKTYIFHRASYKIDIRYEGLPPGTPVYYQFTRDGKPAETKNNPMNMGITTFTGPAVFTEANKFQKVNFDEIAGGKAKFATKANDGWIAMVQHYFVAAWLPPEGVAREFYMRTLGDNLYATGTILPAGADGGSTMSLYAGPQELDKLRQLAPGLELVVDYGWLTVIAAPLFWVLTMIHKLTGNWGWAIIGLTLLIKLAFFPLSAASYKAMAKMKLLAPKMARLKEIYGDDKMRLNQEMMALYKTEKVNPLGGCLPILVQIPVFIALYWVLQGTVEMRNAPWIGWITDLSAQDPYYVLPLIMGVTMLVQTKLNPAPPDPMQAKVMLIMPVVFTVMFLFFPAGLVLYWTVNNLLSIAQQWQITRLITAAGKT
ncbi:MAG: membrane protein insertase YidC [Rhodocyclales bacterium]|jgi:YidC/Oxa1 family membrane protein insertase|nr:membrane protein insertase YidC [Rhodocyclales bacterium]